MIDYIGKLIHDKAIIIALESTQLCSTASVFVLPSH